MTLNWLSHEISENPISRTKIGGTLVFAQNIPIKTIYTLIGQKYSNAIEFAHIICVIFCRND